MPRISLIKSLVLAGLGSRRGMAEAIKQYRVLVNGVLATSFKLEVDTELDKVTFDGKPVKLKAEEPVYVMLNKPVGFVSTTHDERGRRTVVDLLPPEYRRLNLYPVGRLDMDSSGLLMLTNDGDMTYRLTHPSFEKEKEYIVTLDRELERDAKLKFEQGLELEDGLTYPTKVTEAATGRFSYSVVLHEGRKRQLRRMFAGLGYRVISLKRIRMGRLRLGELPEGKTRSLSKEEVSMF